MRAARAVLELRDALVYFAHRRLPLPRLLSPSSLRDLVLFVYRRNVRRWIPRDHADNARDTHFGELSSPPPPLRPLSTRPVPACAPSVHVSLEKPLHLHRERRG